MKAISIILTFGAVVAATILLTHGIYTTELGARIARAIPDSGWNWVYERCGLVGAESTANAELAVWLAVCCLLSIVLVLGVTALLRRAFHRQ